MAFIIEDVKKLNAVTLYSRRDDAIDHNNSDWDEYDKDPIANESSIKILEGKEPTRFICNFEHKGSVATKLDDAKWGGIDKTTQTPKVNYSNWGYEIVKHSLKGIENPPNVPNVLKYKKTGANEVADDVMSVLKRAGIVDEIFSHYLTLKHEGDEEKNNSKN